MTLLKTIELSLKEASDRIKSNKLIISETSQDLIDLSENNSQIKDLDAAIRSLETQMILMDDSVRALNNYKTQLNQTISEIQTQIYSESQNVLQIENQD
jgi:predicted  nucleic acid-binding Zn-ribbon protein